MRLNNDRDQQFVRAAMPEGARGFLDSIPALRNRECIICGEGVAIPIRVAFDNLAEEKRPASSDPVFTDLWQQTGGETEILERTVRSEEHTSELQSLMRISYAVFCLKKKKYNII